MVLVLVGGITHAAGSGSPGTRGAFTDAGFNNDVFTAFRTSVGVVVGECKNGTRVVRLSGVHVLGKTPSHYRGNNSVKVPCANAGSSTATFNLVVPCRDADGNVTTSLRVQVSVSLTESAGAGAVPTLDTCDVAVFEPQGDSPVLVLVEMIDSAEPDERK
jgi:hypothetical protein